MYAALEIAKKLAMRTIASHIGAAIVVDHGDKKISYELWQKIRHDYLGTVHNRLKDFQLVSESLDKKDYTGLMMFITGIIEKHYVLPPKKDITPLTKPSFYISTLSQIDNESGFKHVTFRFKNVGDGGKEKSHPCEASGISRLIQGCLDHLGTMEQDPLYNIKKEAASVFRYEMEDGAASEKNRKMIPVTSICIKIDARYFNEYASLGEEYVSVDLHHTIKDDSRVSGHCDSYRYSYTSDVLIKYTQSFKEKIDRVMFPNGNSNSKTSLGKLFEYALGASEDDTINMYCGQGGFETTKEEFSAITNFFLEHNADKEICDRLLNSLSKYKISGLFESVFWFLKQSGDPLYHDLQKFFLFPSTLVFDKPIYFYFMAQQAENSKGAFFPNAYDNGGEISLEGVSSLYSLLNQQPYEASMCAIVPSKMECDFTDVSKFSKIPGSIFHTAFYSVFVNEISILRTKYFTVTPWMKGVSSSTSKNCFNRFKGKALGDFKEMLASLDPCATVLLSGKPGTGKTLLCQTLSEEGIAIIINNKSFEFLGEPEIGELINCYMPSYIIIDDISECEPSVFGKSLNMLDRLSSNYNNRYSTRGKTLRLIMTCNNADAIPDNFKRPGRISMFVDFDNFIQSDEQYKLDGINSIMDEYLDEDTKLDDAKIEVLKEMYSKTSVAYVEQLLERISNCGVNYKLKDWDIHWQDLDSELKRRWNDLCD